MFEKIGFRRITCEHSIWIYRRDDVRIVIPVFIDDMTIAAKSKAEIDRVKDDLQTHFKLRDLGPTSWLLGVEITRDRSKHTLHLSQRQYVLDLLERFNLSDCNSVTTPMDPGLKLTTAMSPTSAEDIEAMRCVPYL